MTENRYTLAGWLSLVAAVLFPLAFVIGIAQGIIGAAAFRYHGPTIGPSDVISWAFTAIAVYAMVMLRRLLHERYDFHELDLLINIVIGWNVLFAIGGFLLKVVLILIGSSAEVLSVIIALSFMVVSLVSAGIIDLIFGMKLLKLKDSAGDLLKAYAYVTLISGALEVTILLGPIALILVPVSMVILSMIFLKESDVAEFV